MSRVANILRFVPTAESRNDGELLAAFRLHRDEAAFAELVRRHGPLVWGVCRRQLPDHADAEDAFQASFLVLVRRAKSLSNRATVGPWLYKVAAWTARNLRRKNARRLARQSALADPVPAPPSESDSRLDIDAALLALPEKYRAPLVLCHLEGLSRRDAAERLGCPEGTLSSLLSRGLARLRFHLTGYVPTVAVPLLLTTATVRAACATQLAVGASVHHLIEGVLHMFWVKKATAAMTALVVVFGMGLGVGVTARTAPAAGDELPAAQANAGPLAAAPQPDELAKLKKQFQHLSILIEHSKRSVTDAELEESWQRAKQQRTAAGESKHQIAVAVLGRVRDKLAAEETEQREIRARIRAIEDLSPATVELGTIDVTIGGKELGYPIGVHENDKDGKVFGGARIEPQALLVRYLTRLRLDPNGPKKLRLNSWTDAPHDHIKETLRSCQEAGFKEAIFHGRMPTNDPDIRFTPPANDPGGKRDGWFEADEVPIRFDELLKPLAKPKP